jgi:hypothetical protein
MLASQARSDRVSQFASCAEGILPPTFPTYFVAWNRQSQSVRLTTRSANGARFHLFDEPVLQKGILLGRFDCTWPYQPNFGYGLRGNRRVCGARAPANLINRSQKFLTGNLQRKRLFLKD